MKDTETPRSGVSLRSNLPGLPPNIALLPVSDRGYPVPWFVQWLRKLDGGEAPTPLKEGVVSVAPSAPDDPRAYPEFRMIDPLKLRAAHFDKLCWVCGQPRGNEMVFVVGPMCVVNRVSGEPPSHLACAEFSAQACPFLTMPKMVRREDELTQHSVAHSGAIMRNPGVTMLYSCKRYNPSRGVFLMGWPTDIVSYKEGRLATRAEVLESIRTGLPALREAAERDLDTKNLDKCVRRALADLGMSGETV